MHPDRFTPRGPESYGIEANCGIDLVARDQQLIAIPRAHPDSLDPPPHPFPLPPLPAQRIEDKVRLLRKLAAGGRTGLWALYLDTTPPHEWHFYLPPQWCGSTGVRVNLSYPKVRVPGPLLRLAGTLQSAPLASPDELIANLPPIDGVHLIHHPAESWLLLTAFITIAGATFTIMPHQVIVDPVDPELPALASRLWVEQ